MLVNKKYFYLARDQLIVVIVHYAEIIEHVITVVPIMNRAVT